MTYVITSCEVFPGTFCNETGRRGVVAPGGLYQSALPCLAKTPMLNMKPVDVVPVVTVNTFVMGRPRKYGVRKQVTFSVDEAEYKGIELRAGGSVSAWCRGMVLGGSVGSNQAAPRVVEGGGPLPVREVLTHVDEARVKGKSCIHGTGKGYRCWQCGGIAKVE